MRPSPEPCPGPQASSPPPALAAGGIRAGVQKFFAFVLPQGQHAVRWEACDAARHETGSGRNGL
jgi:hypothetical protein